MDGVRDLQDGGPLGLMDGDECMDGTGGTSRTGILAAMGALYFIFGFVTCLNDILVPHLKAVFELDYARAMLIQFSFFSAYFIMAPPSGWLVDRLGCQRGMAAGLAAMSCGCFLFLPAAGAHSYGLFLGALFLLAAGVTLLQVAANPYVAALGRPETASSRLTLTQAFNSLGTTAAPWFGSALILAGAGAAAGAESVRMPYLGLGAVLVALALLTAWWPMPGAGPVPAAAAPDSVPAPSPWRHRPLRLGAVAIFLYVGAEVGIGSFLVNYIHQLGVGGATLAQSARYVSLYWGGAMVGRFAGSAVMRRVAPNRVLTANAVAACALVVAAMAGHGPVSMAAILAVGFFNSIMFPTIFTLAIKGLGEARIGQASGILCMAVAGGAVVPLAQGLLADWQGIRFAFALPALCYAAIAAYGAAGHEAPGGL